MSQAVFRKFPGFITHYFKNIPIPVLVADSSGQGASIVRWHYETGLGV